MKLITWNCNMAFRKKSKYISTFQPDIAVIPECEHPDKLKFDNDAEKPNSIFWFGDNHHKGLGVFSYSDYKFKLHKNHNADLKYVLPLTASNGKNKFNLFAVWANNPSDPDGTYVAQVWKAIHQYDRLIKRKQTILLGDFNSNSIWDRPKRIGNHTHLVDKLKKKNISSAYHNFFKQDHGKELSPTQFMYRHLDKPYHLDYCFLSSDISEKVSRVEIGTHKDWCSYSDHTPVIVTIDF